jgi:flagellar biosynthesis protein FlhA
MGIAVIRPERFNPTPDQPRRSKDKASKPMATLSLSDFRQVLGRVGPTGLGLPALVLMIVAMLVVPLPPILLDLFFTFNIIASLVIVMIAIGTRKPLEFSAFPALLLMATMLRLALNVASTRVVLVNGHNGPDAAGKVIEAFGEFVIGGNYVVGFIIFVILMVINFVVVTKGAGRVSEVIARFTLDAMPGKQMAIDADLSAGLIDQATARKRREEVSQEADFFGSMDGASKFVRGDAIAGLLILIINIVGGLAIGMAQHDLSFTEAGKIYVLLTIGDGLVAQIPALFLSLGTAIIVTRVTTSDSLAQQASSQLANPHALYISGGILGLVGLVPGMPHAMFLTLAAMTAGTAYMIQRAGTPEAAASGAGAGPQTGPNKSGGPAPVAGGSSPSDAGSAAEISWDDVEPVDLIGVEIGYGLIPLVNADTGGQLMSRVKGVRKKLSAELGFLVQPVRIRDSLNMNPDHYHILLNGVVRGRGEIRVGRELAINPGQVHGRLEGETTREPAFGLDAVWIDPAQRDYARTLGYTVVDPSTAIATHLNTLLRQNASELLSHDETQQLLDKLASRYPKLVEDLVPNRLSLGVLTRILQNLLSEAVPIRDMRTIVETLTEGAARTQDPDALTNLVRPKLGRMILQNLVETDDVLQVMTLDPSIEQLLQNLAQQAGAGASMMLDPDLAERLFTAIRENARLMEQQGQSAILVVSPPIRNWLARALRHRIAELTVLSYSEIPEDQAVRVMATVEVQPKN